MNDQLNCREVMEDGTEDLQSGDWIVLSGGDPTNPTWAEYIAGSERSIAAYLEVARGWLENRAAGIPMAEEWCDDHYLVFSDGKKLAFTWRGWGDFAQAVVGKREGYKAYCGPGESGAE
ncbi:MAG: hypothetical protein ACE5EM_07255 [Sphingomonadales bacterium]